MKMRLLVLACMVLVVGFVVLLVVLLGNDQPRYKSTLQPDVQPDVLREQRIRTIETIAALGRALSQYIVDNPEVGAPKVGSARELINVLGKSGIATDELSDRDGWDQPIRYENWFSTDPSNRDDYSLISLGSDGARDLWIVHESIGDYEPGLDIIWRNITGVLKSAGFTHGPAVIRERFADLIAQNAAERLETAYDDKTLR